jgi:hypothetical protein
MLRFGFNADDEGEFVSLPLDSLTHTHFKGMTGYGKSSLLSFCATDLICQGVGVALLDPAGDLSEQVLSNLINVGYYDEHPDALERVLYLPLQRGHEEGRYIPFNVLKGNYDAYAAASVILEGFKRVWPTLQDGFAINIDSLVHQGSYALAEHQLPLLPFLVRLYSNPDFYKALVPTLRDEYIREQFENMKLAPEYFVDRNTGEKKVKTPELADTTRKRVNRLAISPLVRYPLMQKDNLLDVEELLRSGRSVLLNLGVADQYAKTLLGTLFTQHFEQTSKTFRPYGRQPYVLIIDEVKDFVFQSGQALETMFAQARKAGVAVWPCHQYGAQLSDDLNAALSQCATKVAFRLDYDDALESVKRMGFPTFPYWVKEAVGNPQVPGGMRNVYFTESEQWSMYAQVLTQLDMRQAVIERRGYDLTRVETFPISQPADHYRIEQLTRQYLAQYFRPITDIKQEARSILARFTASPQITQSDTVKEKPVRPSTPAVQSPSPVQQKPPRAVRTPAPLPPPKEEPTPPESAQEAKKPKGGTVYNSDDFVFPEE